MRSNIREFRTRRLILHTMFAAAVCAGVIAVDLPAGENAVTTSTTATWNLVCAADNDLFQTLQSNGLLCRRFDAVSDALGALEHESALLVLADGYPNRPTPLDQAFFDEALRKRLKLYVEFPRCLPDMEVGEPHSVQYERAVVASHIFGQSLPPQRILFASSCCYLPVDASSPHLVLAKVAGVDTAVFGLADAPTHPLLFEHPRGGVLVGTSGLSHFIRARYLPADAWRTVWQTILERLEPRSAPVTLNWAADVRPTYERNAPLPDGYELQSVRRCAEWIRKGRVLRHPLWPRDVLERSLTYNTVRPIPAADWPPGDGSCGVLEGFSSTIHHDGGQPMRYAVRNDCSAEVAMLLAFDGALNQRLESGRIAANLLDYIFQHSGLAGGLRADPVSSSYGLVGWALDSPGSYWGDDNARALLACGAVASLSGESRWNERIVRCILANLRTTGRSGFREQCVDEKALQSRGWQHYWKSRRVHYSPHMQSWLWACNFWAYSQTRFEPLLDRSKAGLRGMMQAYPDRWDWILRSGTIERARLLLPLAWLIRVDDTPEHRQWLATIARDLLSLQDECGALRETIGDGGPGIHSNAEYGTRETSLIQMNGDPVSDMLYSCNFALIGLHEAAAATGDADYAKAEARLAQFLARIQTRSEEHPELDGAWYRAFDFRRWEYWASSGDWEWGPWCLETGWSQPWIASGLALRRRETSLWDTLQQVDLKADWARLRSQMLPDETVAELSLPQVNHQGLNKPVQCAIAPDPRYPGGGEASLVDGDLGDEDFHSPEWLGFHGCNLDVVVDLGATTPIRAAGVRCLQSTGVGIYLPTRVEVAMSMDGLDFEAVASVDNKVSEQNGSPRIQMLLADIKPREARFVRIRAVNRGTIPGSASATPLKAWLFVDEVLINP